MLGKQRYDKPKGEAAKKKPTDDQTEHRYYYDDAHGYEDYDPETEPNDGLQKDDDASPKNPEP